MPAKRRLHPLQPKNHAHTLKAQAFPRKFRIFFFDDPFLAKRTPATPPPLPAFTIALNQFLGRREKALPSYARTCVGSFAVIPP